MSVPRLSDRRLASPVTDRLARLDWCRLADQLDERGYVTTGPLLTSAECRDLIATNTVAERFRRRIVMRQYRFGEGEYGYFAHPLPPLVAELRAAAYSHLVPMANRWRERLSFGEPFPPDLDGLLARCHAAGQRRPTPLLLRYGPGGYNRLHQDLYGDLNFPLQMAILLSEPGRDFEGGEFLLTEQQPRAQSRAEVVPLGRGEAVIFAVNHRPARGQRGDYRLTMRHGVSRIRAGERYCLGVIFHDAV